jgi:hypothetical protein
LTLTVNSPIPPSTSVTSVLGSAFSNSATRAACLRVRFQVGHCRITTCFIFICSSWDAGASVGAFLLQAPSNQSNSPALRLPVPGLCWTIRAYSGNPFPVCVHPWLPIGGICEICGPVPCWRARHPIL